MLKPVLIQNSSVKLWVQLSHEVGLLAVSVVYRQWTRVEEENDLHLIHNHMKEVAARYKSIVALCDYNLDVGRATDAGYY